MDRHPPCQVGVSGIDERKPEAMSQEMEMKNGMKATQALIAFIKDESGQSLIEYALVAGIIGLGAVIAMTTLSTSIKTAFNSIASTLTSAM